MTMAELKRRIDYDSRILFEYPTPINLSSIGYKSYTEENFISTYWEQSRQTGISVHEFIAKYRHFDILIESEGIEIDKNQSHKDEEFDKRVNQILSKINARDDHEKSPNAAEHDAYMVALVESSRKGLVMEKFIQTPCWLLTTDHFLIRFQKTDNEFKHCIPIAILPTQLLNILRFVRPSGEKFNEVFLGVFSRHFIPKQNSYDNESIQKILARIAHYKGYTPKLAEVVLSDELFRTKYMQSQSIAEQEDLIHETIVSKAQELEITLDQKNERLEKLESEVDALRTKYNEKSQELMVASDVIDQFQKQQAASLEFQQSVTGELEELRAKEVAREEQHRRRAQYAKSSLAVLVYVIVSYILFCQYQALPVEQKFFRAVCLSFITLGILPVSRMVITSEATQVVFNWMSIGFTIFAAIYGLM
jgi:hypothetical protein